MDWTHVTRAHEESLSEQKPVEGPVPRLVHLSDGVDCHFQLDSRKEKNA